MQTFSKRFSKSREQTEHVFTGEDEELCDLSIAQEGCCMQRGALLCILREEVSRLARSYNIRTVQCVGSTFISSCIHSVWLFS